jgi:hypothetical protein
MEIEINLNQRIDWIKARVSLDSSTESLIRFQMQEAVIEAITKVTKLNQPDIAIDTTPNIISSISFGVYHTTYLISELIYHLLHKNIHEVIVNGGSLYDICDFETILKDYPDSLNAKNPNKVYFRTNDPYNFFSATLELSPKELSDFKFLKENMGKYHTLNYTDNGQVCERKLQVS